MAVEQPSVNAFRSKFALRFAAIAGVLFAIYTFPYAENGLSERAFSSYLEWYAQLAGHVLKVFDPDVIVRGQDLLGRYNLRIVKNCDAMEANILFVSAVLAFPLSWKKRLAGIALGVPALVAVNVLRICSLYYIGIHVPKSFELFHLELWPLVLVLAGVTTFLTWATWAQEQAATSEVDRGAV